jgi:Tol biopolymer transport system component
MPFNLDRLDVAGGEVPVVENVSTFGPNGTADYSVSADGLLAYFSTAEGQGTTLAWSDRAGVTKPLTGASRQFWGTGRLSPEGGRVANGIDSDKGGRDIWTLDVERGTLQRLTFGGRNDFPIWTPNGLRVFFSGTSDGKTGLYSVPADASVKATLVLATASPATPTSFTPDGKTLLYHEAGPDKRMRINVLTIPAEGQPGQPHPLHEATGAEQDAVVSPNGQWVAYTSAESGRNEVYVQPFPTPGPKIPVSLNSGFRARWSHDGRELLYWASLPTTRVMTADVITAPSFRAGTPRDLFQQLATTTWDVSPDRNRFLVEISARTSGSNLAIVTNWFEELRRRAPAKK